MILECVYMQFLLYVITPVLWVWGRIQFNIREQNTLILRDNVGKGNIVLTYCKTEDQIADIFTEALSKDMFESKMMKLGMMNPNWSDPLKSIKFPWWLWFVVHLSYLIIVNCLSNINLVPNAGTHSWRSTETKYGQNYSRMNFNLY